MIPGWPRDFMDNEFVQALLNMNKPKEVFMDKFWVVWNPQAANPQMRHTTKVDAEKEALRLQDKNKGGDYYVLEMVGRVFPTGYIVARA